MEIESPDGFRVFAAPESGQPDFILEKCQDLLVAGLLFGFVAGGELLPHRVGLRPLVLLFVQLFEIRHRVAVLRIEAQHF